MSAVLKTPPGTEAIAEQGWLKAHRWLLLRRTTQLAVLLLFLVGPWFGLWIVKGSLNYSLTLDTLPLADPYLIVQSLFAGEMPGTKALLGAGIVAFTYWFVGGRVFCSWVCPINPLTDLAAWVRQRFNIKGSAHITRATRWWILGMTLVVSLLTGTVAWEMFNPVSMLHRGLIFGMGFAWAIVLAVFLFDVFVVRRGWCGHLCPVGAFYALVGRYSWLRVHLPKRDACNDCMDCFAVCPEQQVIRPALKGINGTLPMITDAECTNCGRCIDVCSKDVFAFGTRLSSPVLNTHHGEIRGAGPF